MVKVIKIACIASVAFQLEPNEISGCKKEFSHLGHAGKWGFLHSPHFPCINSFLRPNFSVDLFGNACYAGSYKNCKKDFRLITLVNFMYILYLYYNRLQLRDKGKCDLHQRQSE